MKKMLRYIIALCCLHGAQAKLLNKAYLHQAPLQEDMKQAQLEVAKLVFYFNEEPVAHALTKDDADHKGWKHAIYTFSDVIIDEACRKGIKDVEQKTDMYQIVCSEQPDTKTVRVELLYDPKFIRIAYDGFDAITGHKGIVFRLRNNVLLDRLALHEKPVLQLACAQPLVIIDCGHGGSDAGTINSLGIKEKDVTLAIGLEVSRQLKQHHILADLTRSTDIFVALDARTSYINHKLPKLFVSIHANSAVNTSVKGLETYCLSPHLFRSVAQEDKLAACYINKLYEQSNLLARNLHGHVLAHMQKQTTSLVDRQVRTSVAQLLLGTNVPGALIEVGFLSHPEEGKFLATCDYQHEIATGICNGIRAYLAA